MTRAHRLLLVLCLVVAGLASAGEAQADDARFALAGGCYGLKSVATGRFVAKAADGTLQRLVGRRRAVPHAGDRARALPLLRPRSGDFMAAGKAGPLPGAPELPVPVPLPTIPVATGAANDPVKSVAAPSPAADWRVDGVRRRLLGLAPRHRARARGRRRRRA